MKPLLFILTASCLVACGRKPPAPLPQRAYVWQRQWTPAVVAAARQAPAKLDGLVVFGAEITWANGQPKPIYATVDWETLRSLGQPISLALRIAPYSGPFDDEPLARQLAATASSLLQRTGEEKVGCVEIQIDFDCGQKKLAGYARWLRLFRAAVKPTRLVITALPVWLDEPAFQDLLHEVDGYILQVHSIAPEKPAAEALVCDPDRARGWVAKASALKRPFEVALSTYSAIAGYDADGKFLGLGLDGVQPAWPSGTTITQFRSEAAGIASLVHEWRSGQRPPFLTGLLWYRLPVSTDVRNWRWPTFAAVLEGRSPISRLSIETQGDNPADLTVVNDGEAEEDLSTLKVLITWPADRRPPVSFDALPGWTCSISASPAPVLTFAPSSTQRLLPGSRRAIGWVRTEDNLQERASLHVEIIR